MLSHQSPQNCFGKLADQKSWSTRKPELQVWNIVIFKQTVLCLKECANSVLMN